MAGRKKPTSEAAVSAIDVSKTYKLYIGGAFPRTESGRVYQLQSVHGHLLANVCMASRKDFRNAVVAARTAQEPWNERSAYNRSQIVYRIAEMLQQRKAMFESEMVGMGAAPDAAAHEFHTAIDLIVHCAGWCDKYTQVYSSVNPVASSHFNFSVPEPSGVVAVIAPEKSALLGAVQACIPAICGGNTCVVLASEKKALSAVSFAEVLATSDLPPGVVNILTGKRQELQQHFASHMDVNALAVWDADVVSRTELCLKAVDNVKRTFFYDSKNPRPLVDHIMDLQEIKTTWHPVEVIKGSGASY